MHTMSSWFWHKKTGMTPLHPSTSSTELVPASTLETDAPQPTTSSIAAVEASQVEGEIVSEQGAPSHIQKAHTPQQIIGNLNERVTWSSRSAHLSYFINILFVALFEPRDVRHILFLFKLGQCHT
jgi:hypothetical protein